MQYDHKAIEKRWQEIWEKNKIYTTPDKAPGKDNFYLLVELPYPSGNLHVGHWYAFAVPDMLARMLRMQGKNVLYPIGFDAFGLPAENAAIKNKINPAEWTESNIAYMKGQIRSMGTMFDWSREVVTCRPDYYKWTQWLFLQMHKHGLVYQRETAVNWCPKDLTVLANEQVIDGTCERCGSVVEQRQMLQWNIKITQYADRLVDDLEGMDWPQQIKESQKNWIGRSEGAEIDFPLEFEKQDGPKPNYLILHGFTGRVDKNFIPWLKQELEDRGFDVQTPQMPNTDTPSESEQVSYVLENCSINEQTIIVGHSLGCVVGMKVVERLDHPVAGLVLVASAVEPEFRTQAHRAYFDTFTWKYDYEKIRQQAGYRIILSDTLEKDARGSYLQYLGGKIAAPIKETEAKKRHFTDEQEPFILLNLLPHITVFTTRADTLFGATYLVLAPEHPWVSLAQEKYGHGVSIFQNAEEVAKYVAQAKKKTELERQMEQKEKTGVKLEGVMAINPATGERIPVYIADYVLASYGTGAIMAVPAHDERDGEFAKKFGIAEKQVVAPISSPKYERQDKVRPDAEWQERDAVMCIVKHWEKDEYLCLQWNDHPDVASFISGGIEAGEDPIDAGKREIAEESGYKSAKFVRQIGGYSYIEFYHQIKKANVRARFRYLYFELQDGERSDVAAEETTKHVTLWKPRGEVYDFLSLTEKDAIWKGFLGELPEKTFTGDGYLVNSGGFDGLSSADARAKMTEKFGRAKKTYRLRDWIVSRQRYWGVPIPMIHCEKCGIVPVPEDQLPVLLPETDDYLPEGTGKSPLAKVASFVNATCPSCGGAARRETDTLDTFVDSSWYYHRYLDAKNATAFASPEALEAWMPIDLYSGGAEHTTVHVLYSRFWQKAFYDMGLLKDPEPFTRRMNRSLIMGPDGQKMSKSRGNVIDPDEVVERLGADTVRMYLAFIGPYNEVASYPWNPDGVVGIRRFLERVGRAEEYVQDTEVPALNVPLHKALKKVGEDASALKFNTAISQMMIFLNALEKEKAIGRAQWEIFLKMLAPFAPHLAEEMWSLSGKRDSIHLEAWPSFDVRHLVEDTVTIAIQIDGKTRGEVAAPHDADKAELESLAREAVATRLEGQEIARTVVVPGRLVNFVLKH